MIPLILDATLSMLRRRRHGSHGTGDGELRIQARQMVNVDLPAFPATAPNAVGTSLNRTEVLAKAISGGFHNRFFLHPQRCEPAVVRLSPQSILPLSGCADHRDERVDISREHLSISIPTRSLAEA
jgi:hypothetical protein